ncbi:hypothetical protein NX059_009519 [Plenodomus lindquistii]|nr:hypothetical protein NX059_009519 [Plenodomus lindquistii]
MTTFHIADQDLTGLKDKVAIITGGSGGIGLATAELLLTLGAHVVSGDIQQPPAAGNFTFVQCDVNSWSDLAKLFRVTKEKHGRIDYVFANAGIGPRADFLSLAVDQNGDPKQPNIDTLKTNLQSVIDTATIAVHYLKSQPEGGNIVLMGSSTGLHPMRSIDYSTAKAGVLGFGRSLAVAVEAAGLPIRVNTLAPSWTATQVLPNLEGLLAAVSVNCQTTSVVARAVAYLFATSTRNGETIYVCDGKYTEIEKAVLRPAYDSIRGDSLSDDDVFARVLALGS